MESAEDFDPKDPVMRCSITRGCINHPLNDGPIKTSCFLGLREWHTSRKIIRLQRRKDNITCLFCLFLRTGSAQCVERFWLFRASWWSQHGDRLMCSDWTTRNTQNVTPWTENFFCKSVCGSNSTHLCAEGAKSPAGSQHHIGCLATAAGSGDSRKLLLRAKK